MTTPPTQPGHLLRCRRVAQLLDVSMKHVYRLIQQGDLEAVRIGARHIRITRQSLDELLGLLKREYPAYPECTDDPRSLDPDCRMRREEKRHSEPRHDS